MSEIEGLIKKIEQLRLEMIKVKEGKSYSDPQVISASQRLDLVLNEYQAKLIEKGDKTENEK